MHETGRVQLAGKRASLSVIRVIRGQLFLIRVGRTAHCAVPKTKEEDLRAVGGADIPRDARYPAHS